LLEETKKKYEELTKAIEDYDKAYEALQKMTKGTKEWKEAVDDLNKQVINLITNYPELY
jgi:chromosome segregation ATPase